MRLPVLIKYQVHHARPNGRIIQKDAFEIVDFDLRTASTEEAPVAVRWNDAPHESQAEAWDTWDESGQGHTRWFANRHWHPLYPENVGHGPVRAIEVDEIRDLAESASPARHFLGNLYTETATSPKTRHTEFSDDLKSREVSGTRAAAINRVHAAISELVVVDGIVYRECHEPYIVMVNTRAWSNPSKALPAPRSMRIVTEEINIRMAVTDDADRVAPLTRFDVLHDLNRLFDRFGSTAIDAGRRPQIDLWESIDEDAYWDRVGTWRMQEFISLNENVSIKEMTLPRLSAVNEAAVAVSIGDRDERLEAIERAARSIAAAWPDYPNVDSLVQLAEDLGAREVNVPLPTSKIAGPTR